MNIFLTIMFLLSIIGIVEIISYIAFHLISVKEETSVLLITPVNRQNYEYVIKSAVQKSKWMGKFRPQKIIILTENLDKNSLDDINHLTYGYNYIEIKDKKDLPYISNLL